MKRITSLFIAIIACLVTVAAQVDTSVVQQSVTDTQIEYTDTPDTDRSEKTSTSNDSDFFSDFSSNAAMSIPIIAIICTFGMPVLIVFIVYYFRYRNKKAEYKLVEQALAAGQPIPERFFKEKTEDRTLRKGINNTFTGVGLFIFLWATTGKFSIGCIGLLVMFMGLGQVVIHYTQDNKNNNKDRYNDDNNISIEE